jgi:hypothetical protein
VLYKSSRILYAKSEILIYLITTEITELLQLFFRQIVVRVRVSSKMSALPQVRLSVDFWPAIASLLLASPAVPQAKTTAP